MKMHIVIDMGIAAPLAPAELDGFVLGPPTPNGVVLTGEVAGLVFDAFGRPCGQYHTETS